MQIAAFAADPFPIMQTNKKKSITMQFDLTHLRPEKEEREKKFQLKNAFKIVHYSKLF